MDPPPYQHKDTPETFWERMRMIHGPDVGPRPRDSIAYSDDSTGDIEVTDIPEQRP